MIQQRKSQITKPLYTYKDREVLEGIFNFMCHHYDLNPEFIKSKTRKQEARRYRQIFYYTAVRYFKGRLSLAFMGSYFRQDHSTVIHSVGVIEDLIDTEKAFKKHITEFHIEFEKTGLPKIRQDEFRIPINDYQKERFKALDAMRNANKMYYECLKHLEKFNRAIMEDRIIEGNTRKQLNQDYIGAKKRIMNIKMMMDE